MIPSSIYYSILRINNNEFYIAATDRGLCYVGSITSEKKSFQQWIERTFPNALLIKNDSKMTRYIQQINEFLLGKRTHFTFSIDLIGTDFQKNVWNTLRTIPYGETRSYSEIAEQIERPTAVRAVANALGKNPLLFVVPCHRVIHKNGDISGFSSGIELKKMLLQVEGHHLID